MSMPVSSFSGTTVIWSTFSFVALSIISFAILEFEHDYNKYSTHQGLLDSNREFMGIGYTITKRGYDELLVPMNTKCFSHNTAYDKDDNLLHDLWYAFE